ncbi:hypothetical protein N7457_003278 [Penicillium paradoxum]|uniref:uncharacterized protein n=1 Tax=Penicillium paradoxum TaxID=176176 RepID=UPI002546DCFA|nr:uncharacterized protein N7457_003278 [Penicillium paradoxum]KAJ5788288.1 hypothetical protein N7457_003278 [Penicillium paradoxum]
MDSLLQQVASSLPDAFQHVLACLKEDNAFTRRLGSLPSDADLSLTLTLQRRLTDPFESLPWLALEAILINLHNLPTLHQLYQASPAVASYLQSSPAFFAKIVEAIMTHRDRKQDTGLDRDIQVQLRALVYLWWSDETARIGVSSEGNPLQQSYFDVMICWMHVPEHVIPLIPPLIGNVPFPQTTPPRLLYRLLVVVSAIRGDAHAFFHGCIKLCLSTKIERPKNRQRPWRKNEPRPPGVRLYSYLEEDCAPSWMEEQRLMQAFLKPWLFVALRQAVCERRTLSDYVIRNNFLRRAVAATLLDLKKGALENFWGSRFGGGPVYENEQFQAALAWKALDKPLHGAKPRNFQTCCKDLTPLNCVQLTQHDQIRRVHAPGCLWAQKCYVLSHSGISQAGRRGDFRHFGVGFFDEYRMIALGLMLPQIERYTDRRDIAYRWCSLLLPTPDANDETNTDATKARGHIRPEEFTNIY